jgi:hypothetical protein
VAGKNTVDALRADPPESVGGADQKQHYESQGTASMGEEMRIWRSDDLATLINEYTDASWQAIGKEILEVLHETIDSEDLAEMTPEELVHWGYAQGAGHLIMAMFAREVRLDLIPRQKRGRRMRRPRGRRRNTAPED